ncbi:hypothetical protein N9A28_00325 [Sulfurimonas sp.]|nr:hypothetical protein [Sulfurimonas sp.]
MQSKTLRTMIDLVIALVIFNFAIELLSNLTSTLGGVLMSIIYILFYKLARKSLDNPPISYYVFMWIPTILFIVLPILYSLTTEESNTLLSTILSLPWLNLLIPIALLFIVRDELNKQ